MPDRLTGAIGLILTCTALGIVIGYLLFRRDCLDTTPREVRSIEVVHDTIVKVVQRPPVYVRGAAKVVYDTIVQSAPVPCPGFVATLDTVLRRDTISVAYEHPRAAFTLALRSAPDSVRVEYQSVVITTERRTERPWWVDALTHLGAGAIGYAVGSVR